MKHAESKIIKVNFSGGSSSGKTTICQYCAEMYAEPAAIELLPEIMIKRKIAVSELKTETFLSALKLQEEDVKQKLQEAQKYLFIDSGPLIFYLGNQYSFGRDCFELKRKSIDFYK